MSIFNPAAYINILSLARKMGEVINTAISKTTFPMHVVILACPESFLVPLRKGGYRGLLKKDSRQAGMTDNVSLLIAFLVSYQYNMQKA